MATKHGCSHKSGNNTGICGFGYRQPNRRILFLSSMSTELATNVLEKPAQQPPFAEAAYSGAMKITDNGPVLTGSLKRSGKKDIGPPPQVSLPAVRQAIIDHLSRSSPI